MVKVADLYADLHLDTSGFERELKAALSRASAGADVDVKVKMDTSQTDKAIKGVTQNVNKATSGINTFTGRVGALVDVIAAVGPAAVPIAAVAVPAMAGLAGAAVAAGGAITTVKVAFLGVGDALKAVNKAGLDPTVANVQEMQRQLAELSPAARDFTVQLHNLQGVTKGLRDAAAGGLFPGLGDALAIVAQKAPRAEKILHTFGQTLGDIAVSAATDLTSARFSGFFTYMGRTAPQLLTGLSDALLDVTHGVTELITSTTGMQTGFVDVIGDAARAFDEWATGLKDTEGFQDFLDYVSRNGPQVAELLMQIGETGIQIVQAWAPVGEAILPLLTDLVDLLGDIVSIPFAAEIISAAGAFRLLARPLGAVQEGLTNFSVEMGKAEGAGKKMSTMLGRLGGAAKTAAGIGGMMALTAAASETNSTLASTERIAGTAAIGFSVGGAWGAAIGAGIGLAYDFAAANDSVEDSLKRVDHAMGAATPNLTQQQQSVENLTASVNDFYDNASLGTKVIGGWQYMLSGLHITENPFTQYNDDLQKAYDESYKTREGVAALYDFVAAGTGAIDPKASPAAQMAQLDQFITNIQPAMDKAKVTWEEFLNASPAQQGVLGDQVRKAAIYLESAQGKAEGFAESLKTLDDPLTSTAQGAQAVATAIDSMITSQTNAIRATDSFYDLLQHGNENLAQNSRALFGQTDAARQNRGVFLDLIDAQKQAVVTAAAQGKSTTEVTSIFQKGMQKIIAFGEANDFSTDKVKEFLKQAGYTPKQITTALKLSGYQQQVANLNKYSDKLSQIPKQKLTRIATDGVKLSGEQVDNLTRKYHLTPKQVKTLIKLDNKDANSKADKTKGKIEDTDGKTATAKIKVDKSQFDSAMSSANSALTAFGNRSETATITTNHIDTYTTKNNRAGGGLIMGPGTSTSDSIPARLSRGEYVIKASSVDKYGVGMMSRINAGRYARGGLVQGFADGGKADGKAAARKKAIREAVAAFNALVGGNFFDPGVGQQLEPGADFRSIMGGVVAQAKEMLKVHAISEKEYDRLVKKARGYTKTLEGLQKQYDNVDKALNESTWHHKSAMDVLSDAQQAYDDLAASASGAVLALQTFGETGAAQTMADAQTAYTNAVRKYGAASTQAAAAKTAADQAAVTPATIAAKLQANLAKVRAFGANINKLISMGFGQAAVQEILNMGIIEGSIYAEALTQALPAQVQEINAAQTAIAQAATTLGINVADSFQGSGVAIAQGIVDGLESQQKALEKQMEDLGSGMAKAFKKALGIKSPSSVFADMGVQTMRGLQVGIKRETQPMLDSLPKVASAMTATAGSGRPQAASTPVAVGPAVVIENLHNYESVDVQTLTQRLDFWATTSGRVR